jgi:hypothetical protein
MSILKKQKAKRRWKDYLKKKHIIKQQIREIANGKRKNFTVFFPKRLKYEKT